jgi:hypothetical protein
MPHTNPIGPNNNLARAPLKGFDHVLWHATGQVGGINLTIINHYNLTLCVE